MKKKIVDFVPRNLDRFMREQCNYKTEISSHLVDN